jgi:nucleoside 2-deoxyribosyltransferase
MIEGDIYVAGNYGNRLSVQLWMQLLESKGYSIAYDWTVHGAAKTDDEAKQVAEAEANAIEFCDAFVMVTPGGVGSHFEFGYALGMCKPCCIVGQQIREDGRPVGFHLLNDVAFAEDAHELLSWLDNLGT